MNIHPQWVYLDNDPEKNIKHVAAFRGCIERPVVRCPQCHEKVTLALGEKNVEHFRHKVNSECEFLNSIESVMHFNTKMHVCSQLKKGDTLNVLIDCYCSTCLKGEIEEVILFQKWSHAETECRVDQYIADVAVFDNTEPVGVIEIFVAHKTEPRKARYLSDNLAWLELNIDKNNYRKILNWDINNPLDESLISQSSLKGIICDDCIKEQKKQKIKEEKVKSLEMYPQELKCLGVRDIDLMYKSGKTYRMYLQLFADYRKGEILRTWMQFKGESNKISEVEVPNNLHHVKNIYRKIIKGSFESVEVPILKYRNKCDGVFVHSARHLRSPEPPRKNIYSKK